MPVFSKSRMPRADMQDDEKARLCSVYFRPWTLCTDFEVIPHVPHLLHMTAYPEPAVRHRKRAKHKAAPEEAVASWASSWARYIRGNIVSDHAARLIRRFLSLTLARRCGDNAQKSDDDAMSEKGDMEGNGAEAVKISLDDAHEILRLKADEEDDAAGDEGSKDTSNGRKASKKKQSHWSRKPNAGDGPWDTSGNVETNAIDEYKKAVKSLGKKSTDKATSSSLSRECTFMCMRVSALVRANDLIARVLTDGTQQKKTYTRPSGTTISRRRDERLYTHTEAPLTSANGSKICRLYPFYCCKSETIERDNRRYRRESHMALFFFCARQHHESTQRKASKPPNHESSNP